MNTVKTANSGANGGANHANAAAGTSLDLIASIRNNREDISEDDTGADGYSFTLLVNRDILEVAEVDSQTFLTFAKASTIAVAATSSKEGDVVLLGHLDQGHDISLGGGRDGGLVRGRAVDVPTLRDTEEVSRTGEVHGGGVGQYRGSVTNNGSHVRPLAAVGVGRRRGIDTPGKKGRGEEKGGRQMHLEVFGRVVKEGRSRLLGGWLLERG